MQLKTITQHEADQHESTLRYLGAKCLASGQVWHWRLLGCCAGIVVRCVWLMGVGFGPGLWLALMGCWVRGSGWRAGDNHLRGSRSNWGGEK